MKRIAGFCAMLMVSAVITTNAQEMKKDAPKSPRVTAKSELADVSYGQPSKRGRVIFGELVPYGEVWRTGANMSTDITVKKDVEFGGKPLKKGTYAVFTIPGETEWTIILNSKPEQRGGSEYESNKDKNVLEVKVKPEALNAVQEALVIDFEKRNLVIKWDMVKVQVPIKKK